MTAQTFSAMKKIDDILSCGAIDPGGENKVLKLCVGNGVYFPEMIQ